MTVRVQLRDFVQTKPRSPSPPQSFCRRSPIQSSEISSISNPTLKGFTQPLVDRRFLNAGMTNPFLTYRIRTPSSAHIGMLRFHPAVANSTLNSKLVPL